MSSYDRLLYFKVDLAT